ncbi:hypothetical protein [Pedobacter puniceum]|uniref:hypothetical protein n=1 Tax=Pedobacter puniceum TaxID=2666136 RepID=UPI00293BC39D|nr:hypothetical protein [Pedobacter puniceum]
MYNVYTGILKESAKNIDHLLLIINSFKTQMTYAERLELINEAANRINQNYSDLKRFNNQNILMSLQRAKRQQDILRVQNLYGIDLPN